MKFKNYKNPGTLTHSIFHCLSCSVNGNTFGYLRKYFRDCIFPYFYILCVRLKFSSKWSYYNFTALPKSGFFFQHYNSIYKYK